MDRIGEISRETKETQIRVRIDLDGSGVANVSTGIGFFDHMLDAFARHGLFDLTVEAKGDLRVDGHHTVEDTGIVLGQAIAMALGDRAGIRRYADAMVPLDEALVRAVVDVSGRPYLSYQVEIPKWQLLGDYDVFLTPEFFRALVTNADLTAHVDLIRGDNPHHIALQQPQAVDAGCLSALPEEDLEPEADAQHRAAARCHLLHRLAQPAPPEVLRRLPEVSDPRHHDPGSATHHRRI